MAQHRPSPRRGDGPARSGRRRSPSGATDRGARFISKLPSTSGADLGDPGAEARTLSFCGAAHFRLGDVDTAMDYFDRSRAAYREAGDLRGEAQAHSNLGVVSRAGEGCWSNLSCTTAPAASCSASSGTSPERQESWPTSGWFTVTLGELDLALQRYREALELATGAGGLDDGVALLNIGDVYRLRGESHQALRYLERAQQRLHAEGLKIEEASALNGVGLVYSYQGEQQLAMERFRQALAVQRLASDRWGEASTFNNIAIAQVLMERLEEALDTYRQALQIWREVGDKGGEATSLAGLGLVHYRLGQRDHALESMNQALEIFQATRSRLEVANTLNNIGWIHYEAGDVANGSGDPGEVAGTFEERRLSPVESQFPGRPGPHRPRSGTLRRREGADREGAAADRGASRQDRRTDAAGVLSRPQARALRVLHRHAGATASQGARGWLRRGGRFRSPSGRGRAACLKRWRRRVSTSKPESNPVSWSVSGARSGCCGSGRTSSPG